MPRRESYQTDDDDTPRRAAASGGGVSPAVWVGGAVLGVAVFAGVGFALLSSRRDAMVRHEIARAELAHSEARTQPDARNPKRLPDPIAFQDAPGAEPAEVTLAEIANGYRTDRADAGPRYAGQRLRVRVEVNVVGQMWAGTSVDLGTAPPRESVPNVIFRFAGAEEVRPGDTVVIDGRCDGLSPGPLVGATLLFSDCRVVGE